MKRYKTKHPGVFYREVERIGKSGMEKMFYVMFKKDGKLREEKAGRQYADRMTEGKAARIKGQRGQLVEAQATAVEETGPAGPATPAV